MIKKTEVKELANVENQYCVSLFIPTHRGGQETLDGEDSINLKTQLKEVKSKLEERGMREDKIEDFVKPIKNLVDDSDFWRNQSDGLAIFLTKDIFEKYTVPVHFEAFNYVSHEFYLKPLMPLFNGNGMFYILALKNDKVAFYEATRHSIVELEMPDEAPGQLEDRVGYDHEQNSLKDRSDKHGGQTKSAFHGYGEESTEEQNELKRYFKAINDGLMTMLHGDQNPPLILCCQDFQYALYKEVNTYKSLYEEHISGNSSDKDDALLHEEAWNLVEPYFNQKRKEKMEDFKELHGSGKATSDPEKIMKSAVQGKVDSLFIENGEDIYGNYDSSKMKIEIKEERNPSNISLMNLVAMKVFKLGGDVYLTEKEDIPDGSSKMNAVLRF
ncbi:MAG: hypothetical protein COA32_03660 [Fluviicola sp.]|nr:MAG: hypothetical protein COA32_03660 [Fluviicola sp.]